MLRKVPTADGFWIFKMFVHQPTPGSMQILQEAATAISSRLLEVHVSLDVGTQRTEEALMLQDFIESRLLPSSRLKKPVTRIKGTTYFNRRTRKGVEVALYADLPSKVTGNPCFHIDWRLMGAAALKNAGLNSPIDILHVDHRAFWDQRLSLWAPPSVTKLARASNRQAGSNKQESLGDAKNQSQARLVVRSAISPRGVVVAHDLLQTLRRMESTYNRRPQRLFTRESHFWMLPPSTNAMWP